MKHKQGLSPAYGFLDLVLVTVVCVGVASQAVPTYAQYRDNLRFGEAMLALEAARTAIERATEAGLVDSVTELDAGAFGIPTTRFRTTGSHGINIVDGAITLTWRADGSELEGETYSLSANGHLPPVQWTVGGSCVSSGFC